MVQHDLFEIRRIISQKIANASELLGMTYIS